MKNTSFLDYYKTILEKVSFDSYLLTKEYRKALNTIHPSEIKEFEQWMKSKKLDNKLCEILDLQTLNEVG